MPCLIDENGFKDAAFGEGGGGLIISGPQAQRKEVGEGESDLFMEKVNRCTISDCWISS